MGFALRVEKGAGEGGEFAFDQDEAKLGRTADNDIVVKDPAASRSHCRVFKKGEKFFVEDLKSANGTKHNTRILTDAREIKNGDTITIGDVVFAFSCDPPADQTMLQAPAGVEHTSENPALSSTADEDPPAIDPNETVLKSGRDAAKLTAGIASDGERDKRTRRKEPVKHDTEGEIETVAHGTPLQDANAGSTMEVMVPPPMALAKKGDAPLDDSTREVSDAELARVRAGSGALAKAAEEKAAPLSAAERARQKRELQKSASGRLALQWQELPKSAKIVFGSLTVLFVLGTVGFGLYTVLPKSSGPKKIEADTLAANAPALKDSFGLGEGVDWERSDMKMFNFSMNSPTRLVVVLHYMAKDISKEEVTISMNGAEIGTIPADTIDVSSREIEAVFPPNAVKPKENNQLIFDNVKNPPGSENWRVWNLWLESIPIPELSAEETARLAKDDMTKADKLYEMRDVGPDNLFKAWKAYREAWLLLESVPDRPQDIYNFARTRMRETRPMLDQKCNALLVEYQKLMNSRPPQRKLAIQMLKDIERYFPTREHPCFMFSKGLLDDMGAW